MARLLQLNYSAPESFDFPFAFIEVGRVCLRDDSFCSIYARGCLNIRQQSYKVSSMTKCFPYFGFLLSWMHSKEPTVLIHLYASSHESGSRRHSLMSAKEIEEKIRLEVNRKLNFIEQTRIN